MKNLILAMAVILVSAESAGLANSPTTQPAILKESVKDDHVMLTVRCLTTMVSGKENVVDITIHNNGKQPIQYIGDYNEEHLDEMTFAVTCDDDFPVHPTEINGGLLIGSNKIPPGYTLDGGHEVRLLVNFTRLFDLSITGQYEIVATWRYQVAGENKGKTITTAPLKPTVIWEKPKPLGSDQQG